MLGISKQDGLVVVANVQNYRQYGFRYMKLRFKASLAVRFQAVTLTILLGLLPLLLSFGIGAEIQRQLAANREVMMALTMMQKQPGCKSTWVPKSDLLKSRGQNSVPKLGIEEKKPRARDTSKWSNPFSGGRPKRV